MNYFKTYLLLIFSIFFSCSSNNANEEYINKVTGRYLFNSDEVMEVFFENKELLINWRGATNIKPLHVDNNVYFVKELNEKIQFLTNPADNKFYISLIPKNDTLKLEYNFVKLDSITKVPSEYLVSNNFKKALDGYLKIKAKDSLDPVIEEALLNRLGYRELRNKNIEFALNVFKINAALYPYSPNVYDSLGEAYMNNGDSLKSIENYKKSLTLDSGNRHAKNQLKKLEKKD